jgi:hypothetical protein
MRRRLIVANLVALGVLAGLIGARWVDAAALDLCRVERSLTIQPGLDPWAASFFARGPSPEARAMYEGVLHPVATAELGLLALRDGDTTVAEASLAALRGAVLDVDGLSMIPYGFDWDSGWWHLRAPWYSAMAQGEALSLAVRLGDRAFAEALLPTLLEGSPVVHRSGRDLWLEEYVTDPHNPVLNGAIFAAFGLYDEWKASGSEEAHAMLVEALGTLRRHLPEFRRVAEASAYDLRGESRAWGRYGTLHVVLMRTLAEMTDDACFATAADAFERDYRP